MIEVGNRLGLLMMKRNFVVFSLLFGMLACLLAFTSIFKTPPAAITIFSLLGVITGIGGFKEQKALSSIGIILSIIAFAYLVFLFVGLAG